jgi:hypothetical protein
LAGLATAANGGGAAGVGMDGDLVVGVHVNAFDDIDF